MKKRKIFLRIFLIVLAVIILFRIYNLITIIKFSNAMNEVYEQNKYSYSKITQIGKDSLEVEYKMIIESSNNGDVSCSKHTTINDNETIMTEYSFVDFKSKNEFYNIYSVSNDAIQLSKMSSDNLEYFTKLNEYYSYNYIKNIKSNIENKSWISLIKDVFLYPITYPTKYNGIKCNVILNSMGIQRIYIDKESNLIIKDEIIDKGKEIFSLVYEYSNEIPEDMNKLPNIEDYKKVGYQDVENSKHNDLSEPEKAISNTELKPGETLYENIELLPEEELNFLNLTGNTSGIVSFPIEELETYNKFREKYSNLRELTEEDFDTYRVFIAYKEGYKLDYKSEHESVGAYIINCIVEEEKIENENLLLVVTKRFDRNYFSFTESFEDAKIDADKAHSIVDENLDEIQKELKLEEFDFGAKYESIEKLNSEMFSKMNYIKTPIEGKEPLCWKVGVNIMKSNGNSAGDLEIYINAVTGELIGVIIEKN